MAIRARPICNLLNPPPPLPLLCSYPHCVTANRSLITSAPCSHSFFFSSSLWYKKKRHPQRLCCASRPCKMYVPDAIRIPHNNTYLLAPGTTQPQS
ncbi:hypothetical protein COCVIDRAFT_103269 [Bipolaris victoriae FI3]|uniref:Uncharacterized protein n=1 Tax=Bipolaris victoriae (strain FI3) TaxID=930091 RepID=W7E512_BIPV3|nr:hypothetical protein COCVIDRAFT_103269 [Bipolaris victoriae FI3]